MTDLLSNPQPTPTPGDPGGASNLHLLSLLADDVRAVVDAATETLEFSFGDVVFRQGEPADGLYEVVSGRARAVIDDAGGELPVAMIGPGETFGERAALDGELRSATIRATEDLVVRRVDAGLLRGLAATNPAVQDALVVSLRRIELNTLFQAFPSFLELSDELTTTMLRGVETVLVPAGEAVFRSGDEAGALYLVKSGRLRAVIEDRNVAFYRSGDSFGERSLVLDEPRHATVEAVVDAELLALPPDVYRDLIDGHDAFATAMRERADQYDYKRVARVPVDFADELLPAGTRDTAATASGASDEDRLRAQTLLGAADADVADEGIATPFARDGRFIKSAERIRRFRHRYQVDEADCGAACMSMIAGHHGQRVGLSRAREAAGTDATGSSLAGLVRAGEELGMHARSVKASVSNLDHLPLPAVVHWEGIHWVVLYQVDEKRVALADPAVGLRKIPRQEFIDNWTGYAALFEPGDKFEKSESSTSRLGWAKPFVREARRTVLLALLLSLVSAAAAMVTPLLTQTIVDRVLVENDRALLTTIVLGLVGTVSVLAISNFFEGIVLSRGAAALDRSTLSYLSDRLLKLPLSYFQARRTGDIQERLDGMQELREFAVGNVLASTTSILRLVFSLFLMLRFNVLLSLVWLAATPVYLLLLRRSSTQLRPLFDLLGEAYGRYSSKQIDAIKGIETVKASAAEHTLKQGIDNEFGSLTEHQLRADGKALRYSGIFEVLEVISLALFLWVGALQVLDGSMTVGEFVAFNALVALATGPVMYLVGLFDDVQAITITLDRLDDIFAAEPEQGHDHGHLRSVPSLEGRVTLDNVSFGYGGPTGPQILDNVSLDVAPGTTVAIVGRSGSGKSTLAKLLAGMLDPTEGAVLYDGVDLAELNHRELRRHIGVVLQDTYVFNQSIANNIGLADTDPDPERVEWAAKVASAHSFIHRLPLGYDTVIGESGLRLSGGQLQRVAIARAVYNQPAILLMDEATSALDVESERAVQENMERLLEGRTAFVIAHRLSTIRNADQIVVLDAGHIVEVGDHDELMARKGLYFYLSSQQLDL